MSFNRFRSNSCFAVPKSITFPVTAVASALLSLSLNVFPSYMFPNFLSYFECGVITFFSEITRNPTFFDISWKISLDIHTGVAFSENFLLKICSIF